MENDVLKKPKPSLRKVAPLTYGICWGYVYTNILIGVGLILTPSAHSHYIIVRSIFTYQFWGALFILLALTGLVSLLLNRWRIIQGMLVSGLVLKSFWLYALIFSLDWSSLTIFGMFSFLAYIQFLTVLHFPEAKNGIHK